MSTYTADFGTRPWPELYGDRSPWLYRLLNRAGEVVYVGVTESLNNRMKAHEARTLRVGLDYVGFAAVEMPTRAAAEAAEAALIVELRPRDNRVVGTGRFGGVHRR